MRPASGWSAVVLVGCGAIVAQAFGRFTYSVLLPAVRDDLGHSNTIAGLLGTINVGSYLIGTFVVSTITARFRLLDVFRTGFAFSLTGLAIAAFAPNAAVLGLALFVMGLGGAMIWIPSPAIAAAAVDERRRGTAIGGIGAGIGVGIVFSGQLARFFRERGGDAAWREVYRVDLVLAVLVVLAILGFLRHRQDRPSGERTSIGVGVVTLKRMPGWGAITGAYTAYGFCYLLAISFLTSRLEDDAGFSEGLASTMFTLIGVGAIVGGIALGAAADRFGERATMTVGYAAFAAALGAVMTGVVPLVAIGAVTVGAMFGGLASVIAGYVVANTTTAAFGPSYAAATLAFGVAQLTAPQVGGLIADATGGFTEVFVLAIVFALLGAASSSRLPAR
ncbi:MAG: MFS transporter [Ilumatobacter sp.]